jgi:peptidoglycan hydrolase-like protein with peptidoglycan-binding domain
MKFAKTIVASSAAVVLGFALVASAATFSTYMSVGSTGANVVQLQNWLIANNFSIPAITTGVASPGYYGSQTQAAVKAYQTSVGIPSLGMVGPLTLAALNRGSVAAGSGSPTIAQYVASCPAGFTCPAPVAIGTVAGCPAGNTCTPIGGATISTPGIAGILSASLWSSPSGVSVYKGQAYDVASYKLQAGASDMAVSGFTFDFDNYIWLYAGAITLKDETGAVVGTVSNLNASSFVELTAGSDYRITVPASFVVKAAQSKYITVNMSFLSSSDRCPTGSCALNILGASVRSVDGTGVTDTETVTTARSFTYQGSNIGQINVKSDSSEPVTGNVQISTSVNTNNVLLGIFDIKSANVNSTLQTLAVQINTNSTVANLFGTISIAAAGQTYSASLIDNPNAATTTAHFTSLVIPLSADVWTPVSVYANVNADTVGRTGGSLNGLMASTSIVASGVAGQSGNNPSVIDNSYNTLVVNQITPSSNVLTFTDSGVAQTGLAVSHDPVSVSSVANVSSSQTFYFTYTLTAGNNPVFVDANYSNAVTAVPTGNASWSNVSFRDNDSTGDTTGGGAAHFYVDAGNTKTFTVTEKAIGAPNTTSGTYSITALKYGTGWDNVNNVVTSAGSLSASTIGNTLYATASF